MPVLLQSTSRHISINYQVREALKRGLRYLEATQSVSNNHFGGWPSYLHDAKGSQVDWNCFATALVCHSLGSIGQHPLPAPDFCRRILLMKERGTTFLLSFGTPQAIGPFQFWRKQECPSLSPDLDDTALALLACYSQGTEQSPDLVDFLRLFCAYRFVGHTKAHRVSQWARPFQGVFGVWMNNNHSIVIDACVAANVVRLLALYEREDLPGFVESVNMLAKVLPLDTRLADITPYYPSPIALVWFCSQIPRMESMDILSVRALRKVLLSLLSSPPPVLRNIYDFLLWTDARLSLNFEISEAFCQRVLDEQWGDGGWAEGPVCCQIGGVPEWTSRAVTTALAIQLLCRGFMHL